MADRPRKIGSSMKPSFLVLFTKTRSSIIDHVRHTYSGDRTTIPAPAQHGQPIPVFSWPLTNRGILHMNMRFLQGSSKQPTGKTVLLLSLSSTGKQPPCVSRASCCQYTDRLCQSVQLHSRVMEGQPAGRILLPDNRRSLSAATQQTFCVQAESAGFLTHTYLLRHFLPRAVSVRMQSPCWEASHIRPGKQTHPPHAACH